MGRLFTPKGTVLIPAESKTFWQIRGEDKLQTSFLVERGFLRQKTSEYKKGRRWDIMH